MNEIAGDQKLSLNGRTSSSIVHALGSWCASAADYASASDPESITLSAPPSDLVKGGGGKLFT